MCFGVLRVVACVVVVGVAWCVGVLVCGAGLGRAGWWWGGCRVVGWGCSVLCGWCGLMWGVVTCVVVCGLRFSVDGVCVVCVVRARVGR